jgi:hypothetical protein
MPVAASLRKIEEPLDEWHTKAVLHMATAVDLSVRVPHRRVLGRDVGRVADHGVILPTQKLIERSGVLGNVMMLQPSSEPLRRTANFAAEELGAVE